MKPRGRKGRGSAGGLRTRPGRRDSQEKKKKNEVSNAVLDLPFAALAPGLDLEAVPLGPKLGVRARVAELGGVGVDGARAVDFAELALEGGVAEAHLGGLAVGKDWSGGREYRWIC